ncbi:c-type cytochrome [Telmatospirillum sp.]|uniref:c-type cytochrome n=1 Tax=Telmatospirillum sp. TaxID=2079197 RepID=UPI00283EE9B1|nr:c-type cytochrome [Telmatospirillum sp.]MDR3435522.1 c-type cytochrome [Telmatospirillum sp.]
MRLVNSVLVVGLLLCGPAQAASRKEPLPSPPGASACSGCHGAGRSIPQLPGKIPVEIATALQDFKTGKRPATVMDRIAKGFSDDEIAAIAAWYGRQRP